MLQYEQAELFATILVEPQKSTPAMAGVGRMGNKGLGVPWGLGGCRCKPEAYKAMRSYVIAAESKKQKVIVGGNAIGMRKSDI